MTNDWIAVQTTIQSINMLHQKKFNDFVDYNVEVIHNYR